MISHNTVNGKLNKEEEKDHHILFYHLGKAQQWIEKLTKEIRSTIKDNIRLEDELKQMKNKYGKKIEEVNSLNSVKKTLKRLKKRKSSTQKDDPMLYHHLKQSKEWIEKLKNDLKKEKKNRDYLESVNTKLIKKLYTANKNYGYRIDS